MDAHHDIEAGARRDGIWRARRISNWTAAALIVGAGAATTALVHESFHAASNTATTGTTGNTGTGVGTAGTGTAAGTGSATGTGSAAGTGAATGPHVSGSVATTTASGVTITTTTRYVNGKQVVTRTRSAPPRTDD